MKTELQAYAESFESELVAFRDISKSDFIKKYIDSNFDTSES